MEDFCDYHCHLLPDVDDGVKKIEHTLEILDLWDEAGVKEVWLTPHIMEDMPNQPQRLEEQFERLYKTYSGNIVLNLAAENMLDSLFNKRLRQNDLLTITPSMAMIEANYGDNPLLLVETSYYNAPMDMEQLIFQIKSNGMTPILAHPERYQYMDMDDYMKWKRQGVLLQVNLPSLVGAYGNDVKKKAMTLLKKGMYNLIGTDTHSLKGAQFLLESKISNKCVKMLRDIKL
mgnify:CR=1 FL=1